MVTIIENELKLEISDDGCLVGLTEEQLELFEQMKRLATEGNHAELQQLATRVLCDLPDSCGRTVLSWAAEADISPLKRLELTLLVLADIGDPTAADVNGDTSLHFAALCSRMHSVVLLVEQGVPVNAADERHQTALMWASTPPSQVGSTVLTLVSMGADVLKQDGEGRTALMLSRISTSNLALSTLVRRTHSTSSNRELSSQTSRASASVRRSYSFNTNAPRSNSSTFLDSTMRKLFGRNRQGRSSGLHRGSDSASSSYRYKATSPGLLVIINICNYDSPRRYPRRTGSNSDAESLKKLARRLNCKVEEIHDKTSEDIDFYLDNLANDSSKLAKHDWLMCVIMAHGDSGKIVARDGATLKVKQIVRKFNSRNCPALQQKPKLFIIQACRGGRMDIQRPDGVSVDAGPIGNSSSYCPVESDILICYSATEGSAAYRGQTEEEGSPFIQTLCSVIAELHGKEHLVDLLTIVNQRLRDNPIEDVQGNLHYIVAQTVTQLSKKLYL